MNIIIIAVYVISFGYSFLANRDVFSPSKFYFLFFYLGFNFSFVNGDLPIYVYIYELIFLLLGVVMATFEYILLKKKYKNFVYNIVVERKKKIVQYQFIKKTFIAFIYIFILYIGILIIQFGSLSSFFETITGRVLLWQGLGYITLVMKYLFVIATVFITLLFYKNLYFRHKPLKTFLMFAILLLLPIFVAVSSGSRGNFFRLVLIAIIMRHYFTSRVSIKKYLFFMFLGLIVLNISVTIRNDISKILKGEMSFKEIIDNVSKNYTNSSKIQGMYGITPLNIIYENDYKDFKYGVTYLSAFTNFIPHKIYPQKPSSGGTVLTHIVNKGKLTSAYSPGVIAEGILNFGYFIGPIFGIFLLFVVNFFLVYSYVSLKYALYRKNDFLKIMDKSFIYLYGILFCGLMFYSEFTASINNFITYFILYRIFRFFIFRRFSFNV